MSAAHRLWLASKEMVIQGLAEVYRKDPSSLSRILDIAQDLKAIGPILDSKLVTLPFAIEVAALAGRREYLNLDKWVSILFVLKISCWLRADDFCAASR